MKRFILLFIAVSMVAAAAIAIGPPPAMAQGATPVILSDEAVVDFPESVTFRLNLDENTAISEATLTYQLGRSGCLQAGTQVPVEVDGPELEWTWVMSRSGNPPPGAQMWWQWTLTDAAGNITVTPRQEVTFTDERFDWRTVEAGGTGDEAPIRLHWYEGDEVGPILLGAAVAGLDRLEQDIGVELDGQVTFFIYGNTADMREALLYSQDWVGGAAFADYNTILIGVEPDQAEDWGSSTVRHELAHLVIGQFAQSCLGGGLPTWLSEGLAVYAEGEPDDTTQRDVEMGIEFDAFAPVRSLNGAFPARGGEATSAYSQSYSLVAYLLDNYGQEKMQQLLLALADAAGYDDALEQVYGFNADGLEEAWRAAIGAPERAIPPTPTPIAAAAIPTVDPLGAAQSWPTPPAPATPADAGTVAPSSDEGSPSDEGSSPGLCALGLAPLLLIGGLVAIRGRRGTREERT